MHRVDKHKQSDRNRQEIDYFSKGGQGVAGLCLVHFFDALPKHLVQHTGSFQTCPRTLEQ